MSGFGFIYSFYMVVLIIEIWLANRAEFVTRALRSTGMARMFWSALSLGVLEITDKGRALDHKLLYAFSVIGIPAACVLHGYVGFIFGGIKANPWWTSPMMPVVFLLSAVASGIAALVVMYVVFSKMRRKALDVACYRTLLKLLWGALIVAFSLEMIELMNRTYVGGAHWHVLEQMMHEKLFVSHYIIQILLGALVPLFLLPTVFRKNASLGWMKFGGVLSGLLILVQVLAMRWNVVIGGQLFSRSYRGFVNWSPEWSGREGILMFILVMVMPFILLAVMSRIVPLWSSEDDAPVEAT